MWRTSYFLPGKSPTSTPESEIMVVSPKDAYFSSPPPKTLPNYTEYRRLKMPQGLESSPTNEKTTNLIPCTVKVTQKQEGHKSTKGYQELQHELGRDEPLCEFA